MGEKSRFCTSDHHPKTLIFQIYFYVNRNCSMFCYHAEIYHVYHHLLYWLYSSVFALHPPHIVCLHYSVVDCYILSSSPAPLDHMIWNMSTTDPTKTICHPPLHKKTLNTIKQTMNSMIDDVAQNCVLLSNP